MVEILFALLSFVSRHVTLSRFRDGMRLFIQYMQSISTSDARRLHDYSATLPCDIVATRIPLPSFFYSVPSYFSWNEAFSILCGFPFDIQQSGLGTSMPT